MKRIISILMILILSLCLVSCGGEEKNVEPKEFEVAVIADSPKIEDGSFTQAVWSSVESFSAANGITSNCLEPEESTKDAYMKVIQEAVEKQAKIIVLAGSNFETTAYSAQNEYPEIYFLLIDGVPHDSKGNYETSSNVIGVIFAEEEAGYLAGYAAVKEGYTKIGFMGGEKLPAVKRYGHGFVQGAAAAADGSEQKVELRYMYTDTFEPSDDVKKTASEWYNGGTEIIFACGGGMGVSVMEAAEENGGKVIGVDVDQSYLSNTVITSAQKEIDTVISDMLDNYIDGRFVGGTAFNYTASNGGVSLEMENANFTKFSNDDYKKVLNKLKSGKIQLKKDTGVDSIKELTGEWVTIK